MIKFFRKIRQNLLTENKFSKYLLYAIGEIILVVIGILVALQLNNYNDDLKIARQEQMTLRNLKLDFEFNFSEMKNNITHLENCKKTTLSILQHTGKNFSDNFDVDNSLEQVPSTLQYFPQNGFLLELLNSGNLGIIKSDVLRNKLSYWLPSLETLKDREQLSVEFNNDLLRYVIKNGIWKVFYRNVFLGFFDEKNLRNKEKSIRLETNLV